MINQIGVHIKVKDIKKSEAFYNALGFEEVFAYGPDKAVKESYSGRVYEVGGARLEIADGHRAVARETFMELVKSSKISLMINVDGLGEIIEICKQNNIPIAVGVRHYYWGTLEMVVKDPDGVVLVFIAKYDPEEAKKLAADERFGVV